MLAPEDSAEDGSEDHSGSLADTPRGGRFSAGGTAAVRPVPCDVEGIGLRDGETDIEDAACGASSVVLKPEDEDVFGNVPGSGVGGNRLEADNFENALDAADLGNMEKVEDLGYPEWEANLGKAEEGLGEGKFDDAEDGRGMSDWR